MSQPLFRPGTSRRTVLRGALGLGALAAAGPLLAACGGEAGEALDPTGRPDLDGVTLKVLVNQPNAGAFEILRKSFKAETGADLQITPVAYDKLLAKSVLDVQSGAGQFDVIMYWYVGLGTLAAGGVLEDLTAYIKANPDIDTGDLLPSIYDPYTLYEGKRWGLPFDGDTHILYYNTELFERYTLEAPRTWEDSNAAAEKITKDSRGEHYGVIIEGQQVPIILGCTFANRLVGFGGRFLDEAGKPVLASDEAVAALQSVLDAAPHALPTPLQTGFDQALPAFLSGKAAQLEFWTDHSVKAQDPEHSQVVDKWDVVTLPVGGSNTKPATSLDAGFALGVSTLSKRKEAAAAFVKFAASKKQNEAQIADPTSGSDPIRTSTLSAPVFKKSFGRAADVVAEGLSGSPLVWPNGPKAPELLQVLVDELALAFQGKQQARQTLEKVHSAWEKELG
ncbi:ABC-type glycerol-3-phosphate transport system, substrate-binding protein [Thermomonospora echinospora]|uniref:ABC-type glycerol-3-phosphate transport system, substrate-binding protein n=1 Tax=Thermomonospora echinospora TaxID=1992 RepID=A0A1H6B0R5_9ACTN|nr:extracellular solute-binding protein [Thermomonospora echinospora]SEG54421.1 ABC-type glycerol-3-phosphate transport system, substrate-binding protein [Thermomonospora echinospora]